MDPNPKYCAECGEPMFFSATGVSHHGEDMSSIDYAADADHTPIEEDEITGWVEG